MIVGSDKLLELMRQQESVQWRLYSNWSTTKSNGDVFAENVGGDRTLEESHQFLLDTLAHLTPGQYFIRHMKANANSWSKQDLRTRFSLGENGPGISGAGNNPAPGNGFITISEARRMAQEEAQNILDKKELEELRAENEELRKKHAPATAVIMERIEPYIPSIMEAFFPGRGIARVAGPSPAPAIPADAANSGDEIEEVQESPTTDLPEEDLARIGVVLETLRKHDENFIDNLELLAELIRVNPSAYFNTIPIIKTLLPND